MAIRRLTGDSSGALTYDQVGFDMFTVDDRDISGLDHTIFRAMAGTSISNIYYLGIPANKTAHWIGIHNCGTKLGETCSVQAASITGDDLAKNGTSAPGTIGNYIEIMPGDIVYGKFTEVSMVKTTASPTNYTDTLRLIRGI